MLRDTRGKSKGTEETESTTTATKREVMALINSSITVY